MTPQLLTATQALQAKLAQDKAGARDVEFNAEWAWVSRARHTDAVLLGTNQVISMPNVEWENCEACEQIYNALNGECEHCHHDAANLEGCACEHCQDAHDDVWGDPEVMFGCEPRGVR